MRAYTLFDGTVIDLDQIIAIHPILEIPDYHFCGYRRFAFEIICTFCPVKIEIVSRDLYPTDPGWNAIKPELEAARTELIAEWLAKWKLV